ncbi:hypothetical protein PM082_019892 [Marasmius tenuissimus]|nr:hypothetical protein PM082_019892 [Marasmius tenuissimus]
MKGFLAFVALAVSAASVNARTFTVKNNCAFTIWRTFEARLEAIVFGSLYRRCTPTPTLDPHVPTKPPDGKLPLAAKFSSMFRTTGRLVVFG